jgi:hypothetical protein
LPDVPELILALRGRGLRTGFRGGKEPPRWTEPSGTDWPSIPGYSWYGTGQVIEGPVTRVSILDGTYERTYVLIRYQHESARSLEAARAWTNSEFDIAKRFQELSDRWREDTAELSSIPDIVTHPSYLQIIGLGRAVLPFILEDLEREPNHWFIALSALSGGQNPVRPEHRGRLRDMAHDWLTWGRAHGYIL